MSIEIDSFYNVPLASNPSRPCILATPVARSTIINFFIISTGQTQQNKPLAWLNTEGIGC
jgi:hypothetical protein